MNISRLVIKEILHRKLNFALGILSVLVAVGGLVAQYTILRAYDLRTGEILVEKEKQTEAEMRVMEDDYRKIMKKLGFNLLILPEQENLDDFYVEGRTLQDMPEEYVKKLAAAGLVTIRHLLPTIEQKIAWSERGGRVIILNGTRGEMQTGKREIEEPILTPVPPGTAVLGHRIAGDLGLKTGDAVTLLGESFTVGEVYPERGTAADVTVWVDLAQAQKLLNRPGRISAILALKCQCEGSDLPNLRKQIGAILPGTHVIWLADRVATRAEARDRAALTAQMAVESEKRNRAAMRAELEAFAAWLVPLVTVGAAVWIGLLALMNVRERTAEIGILRALGFRSSQVLAVFLARALLMGFIGAVLGYGAGFTVGLFSGEVAVGARAVASLFRPGLLLLTLGAAPLLAAFASWPPALLAARQDPALALREE